MNKYTVNSYLSVAYGHIVFNIKEGSDIFVIQKCSFKILNEFDNYFYIHASFCGGGGGDAGGVSGGFSVNVYPAQDG